MYLWQESNAFAGITGTVVRRVANDGVGNSTAVPSLVETICEIDDAELPSTSLGCTMPATWYALLIVANFVRVSPSDPVLLNVPGQAPGRWRELVVGFLFKLFGNPIIVGILAGFAWHLTGLALPSLPARFVDAIADTAGPLALFAMGLSLRKFGISGNLLPSVTLSVLKLMLMPAVVLAAAWMLGLPPLAAKVAVATASMPTGVNSYLIAVQFRTGQGLASSQLTLSTVAAVVTTVFWLAVAHAVFG